MPARIDDRGAGANLGAFAALPILAGVSASPGAWATLQELRQHRDELLTHMRSTIERAEAEDRGLAGDTGASSMGSASESKS